MANTIAPGAWFKVVLHAAKHPVSDVNGLLLGSVRDGGVDVVDAAPLFHHPTAASTLEAATLMVRARECLHPLIAAYYIRGRAYVSR